MFRFLGRHEQLLDAQRKNQALQARCKDLEDAVIELASIITEEDEADGEDIPAENPS